MITNADNEATYLKMEEKVMFEEPYSPMKHFLFDLPEIVATTAKWIVVFLTLEIFAGSMALAVAEVMLEVIKET